MKFSYHDVVVTVDGTEIRISDNYAYELTCCRSAGWRLFWNWSGESRLVGGEYDSKSFRIDIKPRNSKKEQVVCGREKKTEKELL